MILPNGDYPSEEEKALWSDEYTEEIINEAIQEPNQGGLKIQTHTSGCCSRTRLESSFFARDFVQWLMNSKFAQDDR